MNFFVRKNKADLESVYRLKLREKLMNPSQKCVSLLYLYYFKFKAIDDKKFLINLSSSF
jgi:hypothetical protein